MDDRDVIAKLASGHVIRSHCHEDSYSHTLEPAERIDIISSQLNRLIDQGWLHSFNGGYRLTDEGLKAYLRSTDELGDGSFVAPVPEGGTVE